MTNKHVLINLGKAVVLYLAFISCLRAGENQEITPPPTTPTFQSVNDFKPLIIRSCQRLESLEKESGRQYPGARFKILEMKALSRRPATGGPAYLNLRELARLARELDADFKLIAAGKDPLAGRTGLIDGAYISPIDGSVQPYNLYIPESYKAALDGKGEAVTQKIPMVVRYHGYNPSYNRTSWLHIGKWTASQLEQAGLAMLMPFGRSNTDFLSVGEADVFAAIESVAARYPIDRTRLYLSGYSMGGSGVWTTLAHYPGIFAAAYIRSGRTDYYYWQGCKRGELPAYIRLLINTDNPLDLAENLRDIPLKLFHPRGDTVVKPGHTSLMVERLTELGRGRVNGLPAPLDVSMPPGGTHWDFTSSPARLEIYKWMLNYRLETHPKEVEITTFTPKYGRRAWINIELIKTWGKRAYLRARFEPELDKVVIEQIENVSRLAIDSRRLPTSSLQKTVKNGIGEEKYQGKILSLQMPEGVRKILVEGAEPFSQYRVVYGKGDPGPIPALRKSPQLCGPVKEAFNGPFMLVKGTRGTAKENRQLAARCARFAKEWRLFAKGEPREKDDVDITPEDIKSYNLVCFGNPTTNGVLAKVGKDLPFKFLRDGYGVGDAVVRGRRGDKLGFLACYPNPQVDNRLLVIADGLYYGDYLRLNHKWDLVPDYIIFTGKIGPEGTNAAALAGFFDSSWQVDKALQYRDRNFLTFIPENTF